MTTGEDAADPVSDKKKQGSSKQSRIYNAFHEYALIIVISIGYHYNRILFSESHAQNLYNNEKMAESGGRKPEFIP